MAKRTATPSEQSGLIPESSSSAVTASSASPSSASAANSYRLAPGASLETSPPSTSH
ncbi:hypothetical protein ACJ73_08083, partial [Blastomyces percursus]